MSSVLPSSPFIEFFLDYLPHAKDVIQSGICSPFRMVKRAIQIPVGAVQAYSPDWWSKSIAKRHEITQEVIEAGFHDSTKFSNKIPDISKEKLDRLLAQIAEIAGKLKLTHTPS